MEIKQVKELMAAMGRTGMQRLMIKKDGFELELERQENGKFIDSPIDMSDEGIQRQENAFQRASMALSRPNETHMPNPRAHHAAEQEEQAGVYITSPMVGTFYNTPSPDDPPFIKVGDKVEKHTVVCIIEAMKVMNEVKANATGTVAEILIENSHPVEFGTKLFRIV